ncbi:hypothetical protein [Psychromonas aquimarina]|uniref:hypothetical protein n=1 Tax=Psychromonas aquimarina TaxID=444919 RepID=UPI00040C0BE7|nr:hypothetical protein [Psychromonas aquimarina]
MSKPLQDVDAIYASFDVEKCDYVEMNEEEAYLKLKSKWRVLNSTGELSNIKPHRHSQKDKTASHEANTAN